MTPDNALAPNPISQGSSDPRMTALAQALAQGGDWESALNSFGGGSAPPAASGAGWGTMNGGSPLSANQVPLSSWMPQGSGQGPILPPGMITNPPAGPTPIVTPQTPSTGANAGGSNNGGSGQSSGGPNGPAAGMSTPSQGAAIGDPNNTFGQVAFGLINAMNPLAPVMTVPAQIAAAIDGDTSEAPPSLSQALAGLVSSPSTPSTADATQSANEFGEVGQQGSPAQSDAAAAQAAAENNATTIGKAIAAAGGNASGVGVGVGSSGIGSSTGSPTGGQGQGGTTGASTGQGVGVAGTSTGQGNGQGGSGQGGSGGGGGGGGGKVLCNELHRQGLLSLELLRHDERYGAAIRRNRPSIYLGYRLWADSVVKGMRASPRFTRLIAPLINQWAIEMKFQMTDECENEFRSILCELGEHFCAGLFHAVNSLGLYPKAKFDELLKDFPELGSNLDFKVSRNG